MTVAILADIHGNLRALEAVLQDVGQRSPDTVVFAGDLVTNGPRPAEVLAVVIGSGYPAVMGNTDADVISGSDAAALWAREQLGGEGADYLGTLPLAYRVTPPEGDSPNDDLLIVHATPRSCFDLLILEPHPLGTTFTEPTPDAEAAAMLSDERANLIVFGHIHYASAGIVGEQAVASVGAVGFPFDGDNRAAYGLATWSGNDWHLEHIRVAYDTEAVASDLERSSLPLARRYANMLREANWFPRP